MKRMISKSNRALAAIVMIALATMLAAAQAPKPSSKGLVIKGKAPISKEVLKVKLPKPYETRLSNGLQVIVLEQHKLPTFNMQMIVLSGGLTDAQDQHGAALLIAWATLEALGESLGSVQVVENACVCIER